MNKIIIISLLFVVSCKNQVFKPVNLKVEDITNPLGVDEDEIKFSWEINSQNPQFQSEAQIEIYDSEKGNEFILKSDFKPTESPFLRLKHGNLESNRRYWWRVRVKNGKNEVSDWSEKSNFVTGILNKNEWKAKLIGGDSIQFAREQISIKKDIESAFINFTARGLCELHINGIKIGNDFHIPVQTNPFKRLLYTTYDISEHLKKGENIVGFMISGGAYNHLYKKSDRYVLAQLNVKYSDGSHEMFFTDNSWKVTSQGPVQFSDLYKGEVYDSRLEIQNWSTTKFDDKSWKSPKVVERVKLKSQLQPVKELETINAVGFWKSAKKNSYIYDFGKNIVGIPQINLKAKKGVKLRIRAAEILNEDSTLNFWTTGRDWKLEYIFKSDSKEKWQPRFTNSGFRYLELIGLENRPEKNSVTAIITNSDVKPTGEFHCSDMLLNSLHTAYQLSQEGNLMGFPTDCPHRERLGWLGDALQIGESSSYNYDMQYFFKKWFRDMNDDLQANGSVHQLIPFPTYTDEQDPVWQSASIIMPWEMYWFYGDKKILTDSYFRMTRMMDFYKSISKDYLISKNRWGDWVRPYRNISASGEFLTSSYYYKCAVIMSKVATAIGEIKDSKTYSVLAKNIRLAINNKYYNNGVYDENSQTSNSIALDFYIVENENKLSLLDTLISDIRNRGYVNTTGVVGQMPLFSILHKTGNDGIIFRLLTRKEFPSLGYMIENGATTFWEKYHYGTGSYDSHNHVFLGGPAAKWFYDGLCGIKPIEPGFKSVQIKPQILVDTAYAKCRTINGNVMCKWKKSSEKLKLTVSIPQNTKAQLVVPLNDLSDKVIMNGEIIYDKSVKLQDGVTICEKSKAVTINVNSGDYDIDVISTN